MASEQLFIHFSHLWKTMRKCAIESSAAKLNCRGQWSNTMKQSGDRKVVFIHPRAEHSFNSIVYIQKEDFVTWLPKEPHLSVSHTQAAGGRGAWWNCIYRAPQWSHFMV